MTETNPKVFVSDMLSGRIDMDQFYEPTGDADFIVSFITLTGTVTGKLLEIGIEKNNLRLKLVAASSEFFSFIHGESIKDISIAREGFENHSHKYKEGTIISRSVKLDSADEHEYDLFVKMQDT